MSSPDRFADIRGSMQKDLHAKPEDYEEQEESPHSVTSVSDCRVKVSLFIPSTRLLVPGVPDPPHAHQSRRRRRRCRHHLTPPCFRWVLLLKSGDPGIFPAFPGFFRNFFGIFCFRGRRAD